MIKSCYFFCLLALAISTSHATTHVVTFSGTSYSPQGFLAEVGDTVEWRGDFQTHPLASVTIPDGAASFGKTSGSDPYRYPITVAGNYGYTCLIHGQFGMVGGFQATTPSKVTESQVASAALLANPVINSATIILAPRTAQVAKLRVINGLGQTVLTQVEALTEGENRIAIDLRGLPSGAYSATILGSEGLRTTLKIVKE